MNETFKYHKKEKKKKKIILYHKLLITIHFTVNLVNGPPHHRQRLSPIVNQM